jgi:hypothetical protein
MRFTVTSAPSADDKLMMLWLQAPDQQALAAASDRIDAMLRDNPLGCGTPVDNDRFVRVGPLTALYSVSEPDRLVTILDYAYSG